MGFQGDPVSDVVLGQILKDGVVPKSMAKRMAEEIMYWRKQAVPVETLTAFKVEDYLAAAPTPPRHPNPWPRVPTPPYGHRAPTPLPPPPAGAKACSSYSPRLTDSDCARCGQPHYLHP